MYKVDIHKSCLLIQSRQFYHSSRKICCHFSLSLYLSTFIFFLKDKKKKKKEFVADGWMLHKLILFRQYCYSLPNSYKKEMSPIFGSIASKHEYPSVSSYRIVQAIIPYPAVVCNAKEIFLFEWLHEHRSRLEYWVVWNTLLKTYSLT